MVYRIIWSFTIGDCSGYHGFFSQPSYYIRLSEFWISYSKFVFSDIGNGCRQNFMKIVSLETLPPFGSTLVIILIYRATELKRQNYFESSRLPRFRVWESLRRYCPLGFHDPWRKGLQSNSEKRLARQNERRMWMESWHNNFIGLLFTVSRFPTPKSCLECTQRVSGWFPHTEHIYLFSGFYLRVPIGNESN